MAMLAANGASLHGELQAGLDAAVATPSQHGAGYAALRSLFWLVQGQETKASTLIKTLRMSMPPDPASAACVALAEWFIDVEIARRYQDDSVSRFNQLQHSAPVSARVFAELLSVVMADATPYQTFLDTAGAA